MKNLLRQIFCRHKWMLAMVDEGFILELKGMRHIYKCKKCGKIISTTKMKNI